MHTLAWVMVVLSAGLVIATVADRTLPREALPREALQTCRWSVNVMQTNAVAYPADVPRGRKEDREELSVAETIRGLAWQFARDPLSAPSGSHRQIRPFCLRARVVLERKSSAARNSQTQPAPADCNLVKVNCAAIPAGLLETEMFRATKRGAFTGAINSRVGRFATGRPRHIVSR